MEHSTRQDTRSELLIAAERLIAEKGLGSVSVKMITNAAGARNPSAVHYHFGSIEDLIKEVFAKRYLAIEEERNKRLLQVKENDPDRLLGALMEAAIGPFMEACLEEDGRLYVKFCLQFTADPRFDYANMMAQASPESIGLLRAKVVSCLQHVAPEKLVSRLRHGFMISLVQTAEYAKRVEAGAAPPIDEAIAESAVCLAAYLSAPS